MTGTCVQSRAGVNGLGNPAPLLGSDASWPSPGSTSAPATSVKPCAGCASSWRATASAPSGATRTTPSAGASSARRRPPSRTSTSTPTGRSSRCGATADGWTRSAGTEAFDEVARRILRDPGAPRSRLGGHLPRQPDRPQPRGDDSRAALHPRAPHPQPLLGDVGRPASAPPRGDGDVRPHAAPPGPGRRPDPVLPRARRQPARLERQHDDRARRCRTGSRREARGGRLVVVDPRRTETAALADEHLFIRPGTDALLLAALVRTVFEEKLERPGRLAELTERARRGSGPAVAPFSPERVAGPTGIPADDDPRPRARLRRAPSPRWPTGGSASPPRPSAASPSGSSTCSTSSPATSTARAARCSPGRRSNPLGLAPRGGTTPAPPLPRARAARVRRRVPRRRAGRGDASRGPGTRSARWWSSAATRCSRRPTGRSWSARSAKLDFMVSIDLYRNETTRHAHVLLPPTSALEREHYDVVFHVLAVRNTVQVVAGAVRRPRRGREHDWEIFHGAHPEAPVDGAGGALAPAGRAALRDSLTPRRLLDLGLRAGPYGLRLRSASRCAKLEADAARHRPRPARAAPCPDGCSRADRRIRPRAAVARPDLAASSPSC